jgi:hypothetical protein
MNQFLIVNPVIPPQPPPVHASDALIINSDSSVISQDIINQLQEQFGDNKQIYIINSSNNSVAATAGTGGINGTTNGSSSNAVALAPANVQYLVVDKTVDINLLLQDPAFQLQQQQQPILSSHTPTLPTSHLLQQQQQQQQPQQHQQQKYPVNGLNGATNGVVGAVNGSIASVGLNSSSVNGGTASGSGSNHLEESVQRLQEAPPKRKKFDYTWDPSKKMTYQVRKRAFLHIFANFGVQFSNYMSIIP